MRNDYRAWLEAQKYGAGTVNTLISRAGGVEGHYGNLDDHFATDQMESLISVLHYNSEDERRGRPNPSKIVISGNLRTNLASYRNAVENYRRFLSGRAAGEMPLDALTVAGGGLADVQQAIEEDLGQRIGLERDMQAALRLSIDQLEEGLVIIDDGAERYVESGRIDITARDRNGTVVVIELKAGAAGQRAIAQVLSYMGDVALEDSDPKVRGFLIASSFDNKAMAAARVIPSLSLKCYGVKFSFSDPEA